MSTPPTGSGSTTNTAKPKRERKPPKALSATDAIGQIGKLLERTPEGDRKRVLAFFAA
jgi:hypothetical protein